MEQDCCRACHPPTLLMVGALALVAVSGSAAAAGEITSHLGNTGPRFEAGMTPSKLGWGPDDQAYPDEFVVNAVDGAEVVWAPSGVFRMGSTPEETDELWRENGWDEAWKDAAASERPAHEVTITRGFWLYRHEVTNAQYARFMAATGHPPHGSWNDYKSHGSMPVNNVNWHDSVAYARWAGGSLPTEAQWEYAARGPDSRTFPWGDAWDRTKCNNAEYWAKRPLADQDAWAAWLNSIGGDGSKPSWMIPASVTVRHLGEVGHFPEGRSWCGALDLAGGVWEWCLDWYSETYYAESPGRDPTGPERGARRVRRGGSWSSFAYYCRSADRTNAAPELGDDDDGFRVVMHVQPPA